MKVLYIGGDLQATGASFSMAKLIEEEEKIGVDIIPVVRKGNTHNLLEKEGKKHYTVETWSWMIDNDNSLLKNKLHMIVKSLLNISSYIKYKKIISIENPDIIHINSLTTYAGAKAAITCKKPLVWHIREMMEEDLNGSFWNKRQAYRLMKKADCFIAISECVKNKYCKIVGNNKIKCIYNGVDKDLFYNEKHTIFNKKEIFITMAGRITNEKGQLNCLKSLIPLLKTNSNIILCFAGDGDDKTVSKLHSIVEKNNVNKSQVKFLGFVKDMNELWGKTDIGIVYSKFEAFGRVTVEAKMAGALVIGFNSGGTSELIEDGVDGFLFDDDTRSLSETVKFTLENINKSRIIADTGRKRATKIFTSENNAKQVVNLYKEVLDSRIKSIERC